VLSGHITDTSGASISKATVEIRNGATGIVSTVLTNSEGYYLSPPMEPGSYILHAKSDTFAESTVTAIRLEVAGTRTIDVVLHPVQASQNVTVEATAPELVIDHPDRGNVMRANLYKTYR
jgi:hypothetical protein